MSLLLEFILVTAVYMFFLTYFLKWIGGRELFELEKEIKKLMEKAKRGDKEAFSKLNKLNAKRMKMMMKPQLYLFPFIILFFFFLKKRYSQLFVKIFGFKLGWFALFIIFSIPLGIIFEKLSAVLLGYK